MSADHPIPIPVLRPEITLNSRHDVLHQKRYDCPGYRHEYDDVPVPNRFHRLKRCQPSRFEQLPYEIREKIYRHLGLPVRGKISGPMLTSISEGKYQSPARFTFDHDIFPGMIRSSDMINARNMLYLNKSIREDIFQNANPYINASFSYPLNERIRYHRYIDEKYEDVETLLTRSRLTRSKLALAPLAFELMVHITIEDTDGDSSFFHPKRVTKRQKNFHLLRYIESVYFIKKHCPKVESIHLIPDWLAPIKQCTSDGIKVMAIALQKLARERKSFNLLRLKIYALPERSEHLFETRELSLLEVSEIEREDVVFDWVTTQFQEHFRRRKLHGSVVDLWGDDESDSDVDLSSDK
ncbi:hypothetical protein BS50DRAFT_594479 [Corynespora cassiicola Philippines]|uniref:Uncharacterized protein n=1 Tax=Corynespora cassiicola Philippines TaxID=1448308 RepID=A0A2T2N300_CORCC|nr:hypothetical protein BS50DRAFT_594479 [Corynespora cassiicola Philippines]